MVCRHSFSRVNYCSHFHCEKCSNCQSLNDCRLKEFNSRFASQTKYILDLFDNPMWKESITFFVNKERDRIRNKVIDNMTLPRTTKHLSDKGKGYREAINVTKQALLIYMMIAHELGWSINRVTPRCYELRFMNDPPIIVSAGGTPLYNKRLRGGKQNVQRTKRKRNAKNTRRHHL